MKTPPGAKPTKKTARTTKDLALEAFRVDPAGKTMRTDQGIGIPQTNDSLKAGARGPTLLEDFHLREKITRFDHERIPERVVHARGSAAHGYFQVYESQEKLTKAAFLQDPSKKTPVFVRFSTVQGSRGSADTVRDVRGFATKFYTEEGNFDLVGNNMPVFFIQDGIKFPDIIHAVKPEPDHEMPQGGSAHDSFYDFVSLQPETMHHLMWAMSDRGIPRSYRMMEGFGVHTFKLVNARGKVRLCKFHWKPMLGLAGLVWDEAQKIAGKDPDFHRRDLWEAIASGAFPEWELGVQVVDEGDELRYGFDLLDPTKLLPEELVPVQRIGKMTLDRNPQNFFAETEQVAYCVQNIVPGLDFTNDPLMQARLFSYLDTQLTRLGGPNFAQIPINRPIAPVHNNQQDGFGQATINTGKANYFPNSVGGGCPFLAGKDSGFVHTAQALESPVVRHRSPTFDDHYSQATLFVNSLTAAEKLHLIDACKFEVGKVERKAIRERIVGCYAQIDAELGAKVAAAVGVAAPKARPAAPRADGPKLKGKPLTSSPALSMETAPRTSIATRKVAILVEDGVRAAELSAVRKALLAGGAVPEIISGSLGTVEADDGSAITVDKSLLTVDSVLYDAVYVPGGEDSIGALGLQIDAQHFLMESFKHCKAIGGSSEGAKLVARAILPATRPPPPAGTATARANAKVRRGGAPPPPPAQTAGAAPGVIVAPAVTPAFTK
ncbi:MAG TPA: catalase, partial [Labilithrix sp.]|nr:catalase [Labilithrix sp.]